MEKTSFISFFCKNRALVQVRVWWRHGLMAKLQAYILLNDGSPKKQWYILKDLNNHHYVVSFVDSTLEYYPTLQESRDYSHA